jgi:hypothetical protein
MSRRPCPVCGGSGENGVKYKSPNTIHLQGSMNGLAVLNVEVQDELNAEDVMAQAEYRLFCIIKLKQTWTVVDLPKFIGSRLH